MRRQAVLQRLHRGRRRRAEGWCRTVILAIILLLHLAPGPGHDAFAIREANYAGEFAREVLPYYERGTSGSFQSCEGVNIRWVTHEVADETGALVVLVGRAESCAKYAEVIYDLKDLGLSIYLMDHAGQGLSGRILADPEKGHIRDFDAYVRDFRTFVETVVNARPHARRFLLAHSMGGCIGALYCQRYPDDFDAVILSSPMLEINTAPYPAFIAYGLVRWHVAFGNGEGYAPGEDGYDPDLPFEENEVTHCRVRFEMNKDLLARRPEAALGGPTNRWVMESIRASRTAIRQARELRMPVLLLQAGADEIVRPGGQDRFCRRAPQCRRVRFPDAAHEILMERDSIRDPALEEIRTFLRLHSGR